jgi:large subunit ribosomal protein L25
MNTVSLAAQIRTAFGKNQVKQLKNSGLIPAIVYGNASEPVAISVNPIELQKLFSKSEFGKNTLISLELPDTKLTVIPHAFDRDVFTQQFTHADFKLVSDTVPVVIETPLVFKGIAPGTKMGGLLEKKVFKAKISCLPQDVPANIVVDISNMGIGSSIFLKDLTPPNGVSYVTSGNTLIARISVPRGKTEEDASATPAKK